MPFSGSPLCTARSDKGPGESTSPRAEGRCAPPSLIMEGEGETSARVETKSGRKKKVRECELHPQHLWCAPCQNRRTKRPCEGPRTHMQEATVPVSATKDKTDTLSQAACATASTDPSVVRSRPVRTSAARDAEGDSRSIGETAFQRGLSSIKFASTELSTCKLSTIVLATEHIW